MDRSAALSILGLLLIIAVLVDTLYFNEVVRKWEVDATSSIVNTGNESVRYIIKPPEIRVMEYEGKSIIMLENLSSGEGDNLLAEEKFRNALASEDRLLLYTSESGVSAVIASSYFNSAEVRMLSIDERVVRPLKSTHSPGITNISYIDVSDPTNARVERAELEAYVTSILVPPTMDYENFSAATSSTEFNKVIEESRKLKRKTLLLYHPSKSSVNVIVPVNFSNDEVKMLAKNSAVKTALQNIEVGAGQVVNLEESREFQNVDMARLPYRPNTKIYASFNIRGELGFLSEDILIYLAIFVVVLVLFYVIYTIIIA